MAGAARSFLKFVKKSRYTWIDVIEEGPIKSGLTSTIPAVVHFKEKYK
jgi:hypothetical protein